jgi:hypothetical protein
MASYYHWLEPSRSRERCGLLPIVRGSLHQRQMHLGAGLAGADEVSGNLHG